MDLVRQIKDAFFKLVDRANGTLSRVQEKTGVDYSIINRLNSGKRDFKDIPAQTLEKLFPEMKVYFFREDYPPATAPPGQMTLTAAERKILQLMRDMDEDGQMELLAKGGALHERHSKNKPISNIKTA